MKDGITLGIEAVSGTTKKDESAARIHPIVTGYFALLGGQDEPNHSNLADMLSDLHHWADVNGVDWDAALATGERNHFCESD